MPFNRLLYREELKNKGLCVSCAKIPALHPFVQCQGCREKRDKLRKAQRDNAKAAGMCMDCYKEPVVDGRVTCEKCTRRHLLQKQKLLSRYKDAERYATRRELLFCLTQEEYEGTIRCGKCHYCGQKLPLTGGCLDRKNNDPMYNRDTAVSCCVRCNKTFMDQYTYEEKLILAQAIKKIDKRRITMRTTEARTGGQ